MEFNFDNSNAKDERRWVVIDVCTKQMIGGNIQTVTAYKWGAVKKYRAMQRAKKENWAFSRMHDIDIGGKFKTIPCSAFTFSFVDSRGRHECTALNIVEFFNAGTEFSEKMKNCDRLMICNKFIAVEAADIADFI